MEEKEKQWYRGGGEELTGDELLSRRYAELSQKAFDQLGHYPDEATVRILSQGELVQNFLHSMVSANERKAIGMLFVFEANKDFDALMEMTIEGGPDRPEWQEQRQLCIGWTKVLLKMRLILESRSEIIRNEIANDE